MEHDVETTLILKEIRSLRGDFQELNTKVAVLAEDVKRQGEDSKTRTQQMESIKSSVQELQHELKDFRKDFDEHIEEEMAVHHQKDLLNVARIEKLLSDLVPNGDAGGHKAFHMNDMEKRRDTAEIKKDVISHVFKGVVWATVLGIFYAVLEYIKTYLRTPL